MKETRHLKTIANNEKKIKNKHLNTKLHFLQNNKNADTTLLHSHDDLTYSPTLEPRQAVCNRVSGGNTKGEIKT